jgi:hypothetical protein
MCVEHYLLILRRPCTNGTRYVACVLCQLSAPGLKRHLVYWVHGTPVLVQPTDMTRTQYTKCRLCRTSWGWASNALNMYRLSLLNKLNKKYVTLVSLHWCTLRYGQQNISFNELRSFHCCYILPSFLRLLLGVCSPFLHQLTTSL